MAVLFDSGIFSVVGATGAALAGATIDWYVTGTTTRLATYSDSTLSTPNTNPVVADANGRFGPMWLQNADYKMILKTAAGVTLVTRDPISGATLAGSNGAGLVGYNVTNTYAAGSLGKHEQGFISVSDAPFNAVCDGTTDDTIAVQAAIDYANAFADAPAIFIPGKCVVSALVVDRRVDTKTGYLRFIGVGPGAGFKRTSAGTIFTSTLTGIPTGSPQSEKIAFECIQFEAANAAHACYVLSKNFLRVRFDNCIFRKIKMGLFEKGTDTSAYAQQFIIRGGHATGWQGNFLDTFQSYNLSVNGFQMEAGGGGFSHPGGAFNLNIVQTLFEGCTGTFVYTASGRQTTLIGNYTEGNTLQDYILTDVGGGGGSYGITFSGNFMNVSTANAADASFWNVILGDVRGAASSGNYCSARLFDDNSTTYGNLTSIGDYAATALNKTTKSITVLPSAAETSANGLALAGANAATATPITAKLNRFTSGSGGGVLPAADYGTLAGEITVINYTGSACIIYAKPGGDAINGAASVTMPSGSSRTFYCSASGIWNSLITTSAPQANSAAAVLADLVTDFNALLAKLRTAGVVGS